MEQPNRNKKNKVRRIGIDARFYGPLGKGLGRYTQEIVDNIVKIDPLNQYVVFLRKENFNEFAADGARVKKVLADVRWYTLAEQFIMPWLIGRQRLDLMHFPHFNVPLLCPVRYVVTIHDLILLNFPTVRSTTLGPLRYWFKNLSYRLIIRLAVRRAKRIISVSQFTKEDILKHFKIKADKISVTYEGVANLVKGRDSLFDKNFNGAKVLAGYGIAKPFLLYVGNAYPHKNIDGLIAVFREIIKRGHDLELVLVGKEDYFYRRLKTEVRQDRRRLESKERIVFTDYVSDSQLEILYKQALAYVFPSFYEGFGLPPLEAMAKGLPVASSNRTSLPEVLGQAAIYFDPADRQEMASQIEKLIKDDSLRRELIARGSVQAKKYSWWECARQTLEVYDLILKQKESL